MFTLMCGMAGMSNAHRFSLFCYVTIFDIVIALCSFPNAVYVHFCTLALTETQRHQINK